VNAARKWAIVFATIYAVVGSLLNIQGAVALGCFSICMTIVLCSAPKGGAS